MLQTEHLTNYYAMWSGAFKPHFNADRKLD